MLKFLHIENIAVIEKSDIEFKSGFNVLTGETGAGKSIIIDSINAVLGERTSRDLIRTGCDSALVSAVFGELDTYTVNLLKDFDIFPDDDGNILITRKLSLSGKGLIKINNVPVTATVLKEISKNLINIHGQHDNQALLDPDKHLMFIDMMAENNDILTEYYNEFKNLNSIRKELQSLETDEDQKERKIDLLKYQINELESANIKVGEIEDLKAKLKIANNFEQTFKALNNANALLSGDDDSEGAVSLLQTTSKQLASVNDEIISENLIKLNDAVSVIEDVRAEISSYISNTSFLELNADQINDRLDYLARLMLKYGSSEELMLDFLADAKLQLEKTTLSDKRIIELSEMLDLSTGSLVSLGDKLTQTRQKTSKEFAQNVCAILEYLNMPNVKFVAQITKGRYTKTGCDLVEFMISANDGQAPKPLCKVASGGELSRVMLSIKSVLLDKDNVGTMIFDEIDTGISGFAAGKVATQLKKVSKNRQVICVTHLAQIAAIADEHLLIKKSNMGGATFTDVTPLDYEQKIGEIARIMSGTEITKNLYNSAKELIDRSK